MTTNSIPRPEPNDPDTLIDAREACSRLGLSRRTLTRLLARGQLVAYRTSPSRHGRLRFRSEDLEAFLATTRVPPRAAVEGLSGSCGELPAQRSS